MSNQTRIITLKCPSCGADLEISAEMDTFYCGYCGTRQMVQRRGGTVSLKLVGEAIARVQVGTDRTAAELALVRLRDELVSLQSKQQQLRVHQSVEKARLAEASSGLGLFGSLFLISIILAVCYFTDIDRVVEVAILIPILIILICSTASANSTASACKTRIEKLTEVQRPIDARAAAVQSEINEHHAFLNSRNA